MTPAATTSGGTDKTETKDFEKLQFSEDNDTDILADNHFEAAIQTLFSAKADTPSADEFVRSTEAAIAECEGELTQAVRHGRLQLEAQLHGVLDARDAVGVHTQRLDDARGAASATHEAVDTRAAQLDERLRVRRNLDAALALVSHTRKLIRTYARIEDVIAARRLHTALHMLDVVDADAAAAARATGAPPDAHAALLHQLYPAARRMRDDVATHAQRILHTNLAALDAKHVALGRHALALAHAQLAGAALPSADRAVALAQPLPWTPRVENEPPKRAPTSLLHEPNSRRPSKSATMHQSAKHGRMPNGVEGRKATREAPTLYIRPLLQCVQVYRDLGRSGELRTEYRSEREKQLRMLLSQMEPERTLGSVERAAESVAGFVVAERAIMARVGSELIEDVVLVKEFWRMAYTRLMAAVGWLESSDNSKVPLFATRTLRAILDTFAETYGLPT